jgi:glycosyltransferase involved in cell wall biosynthesis
MWPVAATRGVHGAASVGAAAQVAINARAAVRSQIGGVERFAREIVARLPALRPERYRAIRPPPALAHRAGHLWEQAVLPLRARDCSLIYSPANLAPLGSRENVVVIHDLAAIRHPDAYSRTYAAYQRRLMPLIARRARMLITVSEFSRRELVELLDVSPERIRVISEGVGEAFAPEPDPGPLRALYGLDRPYALTVGTVSERKNLGVLERSVGALRERGVELVLAGSDRGYLRSRSLPLRRLGYVAEEHLPALYAGARAVVMPSLYEGFGLPCLEAMACGVPVVAAASGALPETVGEAGLLVDPRDGEAFAEALVAAACEEDMRARLVESGLRRAAAFSWSRTASLTDAAIGELLGAG